MIICYISLFDIYSYVYTHNYINKFSKYLISLKRGSFASCILNTEHGTVPADGQERVNMHTHTHTDILLPDILFPRNSVSLLPWINLWSHDAFVIASPSSYFVPRQYSLHLCLFCSLHSIALGILLPEALRACNRSWLHVRKNILILL